MAAKIQLKRATAAAWAADNPTLAAGEIGVEVDTHHLKIGDGVTAWNALAYGSQTSADVQNAITALVDAAPASLNTLKELAAALGDDANFASTVTNALATKANSSDMTTALATKANASDVTTSLALKANSSDVTTSLASKANTTDVVSKTNGTVTTASTSATVVRNITLSTAAPSGGSDGDVWIKYTA